MEGDGSGDVVLVVVADPEADPETAARQARRLRAEIAELDVESVRHAPGTAAPDGAKGADPVTAGAILVALGASGGMFTVLVETVRDWLGRQSARHRVSVTIDGDTIELEHPSADERRDLIDTFVRRHTGG
ncbi:hypothetical protein [Streptomyces sp. MBT53]|uniref:effector-associated constant component EACC1 n=1 Tax=Streptomyces sp. MBT53 TaxID=1488384 RepID=UPI001912433F|nr:hypothetical protein [Streptomyces sp. MBT53]MBK6012410.1 hypothetical protein [Streptomyces sp. MBT53]